jgi:hypothetical protein
MPQVDGCTGQHSAYVTTPYSNSGYQRLTLAHQPTKKPTMLPRILVLTALFLAGCSTTQGVPDVVNVHISPTEYRAGAVRSDLATPVVDAVVHLRPKSVHVSMCRSTPAAKVIQFQTELRARHDVQTTAGYYKVCPQNRHRKYRACRQTVRVPTERHAATTAGARHLYLSRSRYLLSRPSNRSLSPSRNKPVF